MVLLASDHPGEGEASLLRRLLSLAAEATGDGQLVAAPQLLRLSQARGHLCPGQCFVLKFHLSAPDSARVHGWLSFW
jgi:hypothetical protein